MLKAVLIRVFDASSLSWVLLIKGFHLMGWQCIVRLSKGVFVDWMLAHPKHVLQVGPRHRKLLEI